jgi:hypothetical protein
MARTCRECKEPISWGVAHCPHCGEENPGGANPGDVAIVSGLVVLISCLSYWLVRSGEFRKLLEAFFGLFSN